MLKPRVGITIFGRYKLAREIAKGAMGSVWAATDTRLERTVAVKLLKADWAESDDARQRFEREAMAIAKLHSPYIVQIFDYGIDNKCPFFVMEMLKGEDLEARLKKRKRIGVWDMIPIAVQAAKALTTAHQAGIVHRDLKPGNLFLVQSEEEEIVKVLDFGVAKAKQLGAPVVVAETKEIGNTGEKKDQYATQAGTLLGTPLFMSPEQARGAKGIDHRADLWSLGVITFRALTGRLPFKGKSIADTIVKICTAPVPKATDFAPDLPDEVDAFFIRALARDPAKRFKTARELAAAFARIAPRQSYPSLTLPGLPTDVQQELIEATLPPSSRPMELPPPSGRVLAASARPGLQSTLASAQAAPVDVGAGGEMGQSPFLPAPSARTPAVGPTARSEAVTLKPAAHVDFDDDDDDDDEVTSIHRTSGGADARRAPATSSQSEATSRRGIDDEATHDRHSAAAARPGSYAGVTDEESTADRAVAEARSAAGDVGPDSAELTPPPLPGTAPIIDDAPTTDRSAPDSGPASGQLDSERSASGALRESHGTLGSVAVGGVTAEDIPTKGGRLGLLLAAAAAGLVIVAGALYGFASRGEPASTESAAAAADLPRPASDPSGAEAQAANSAEPAASADEHAGDTDESADTAASTSPSGEPAASAAPTSPAPSAGTAAKPAAVAGQPPPPRPVRPLPPTPRPPRPPSKPSPPPDDDTYGSRY